MFQNVLEDCTYCFEIIYPENKIVVDYGEIEDLLLSSIKHAKSGKHVSFAQTGSKTAQKITTTGICCTKWIVDDFENHEGYVISDSILSLVEL